MKYKIKVIVYDPETPKGMSSDTGWVLIATFSKSVDAYGNKHYVKIVAGCDYEIQYDLRYDISFDPENKMKWLSDWAFGYWSGKNGAYAIKYISIEKVTD